MGGDLLAGGENMRASEFQLTPPMWVATSVVLFLVQSNQFQLTPPMWVATILCLCDRLIISISTHTTHVGGDIIATACLQFDVYFNSHHPCGWRLLLLHGLYIVIADFNSHHPCGWRLKPTVFYGLGLDISTHTTHVGGDY